MKMILNKKANEVIDLNSFSRVLDVPDPDVRFRLDLNFADNYSAAGIEYLANYADAPITSIKITTADDEVRLETENIHAVLTSLNESCNDETRNAYAGITIYEAGVNT